MCPLPAEHSPTFLPTSSLQVVTEHQLWVPVSYIKLPLAVYFTYSNVYVSVLLSQIVPLSLSPAIFFLLCLLQGFPDAVVTKNLPANAGDLRHGFNPWVGKIPWRRAWQPTPVFLPGESYAQRSLMDYSPWGLKESDISMHTRKKCVSQQLRSHSGAGTVFDSQLCPLVPGIEDRISLHIL